MERPDFFSLKNGEKVKLPFTNDEYNKRVNKLRTVMENNNLDMIILTSMHNILIILDLFIVHLVDLMGVLSQKVRFQQFQQILMHLNHGEDHIVTT